MVKILCGEEKSLTTEVVHKGRITRLLYRFACRVYVLPLYYLGRNIFSNPQRWNPKKKLAILRKITMGVRDGVHLKVILCLFVVCYARLAFSGRALFVVLRAISGKWCRCSIPVCVVRLTGICPGRSAMPFPWLCNDNCWHFRAVSTFQ